MLMMITSAICWGSWANTYKLTKGYRFELFYWDYAVGIFLVSLIFAFTLGSTDGSRRASSTTSRRPTRATSSSPLIGGFIFNIANLLLVAGIEMAGLAIAFPLSIGIALVVGVVLSYAFSPKATPCCWPSAWPWPLSRSSGRQGLWQPAERPDRAVSRKSIVVCVVSGVLMGPFAPFVTRALTPATR